MATFEKLYIKFEEGNKESLDRACKEAEGLGYKKLYYPNALKFEGIGLLDLMNSGDYMTSQDNKEELIDQGYKEHKVGKLKVTDLQDNEAIKFQNEKEYKDILILLHESGLTRCSGRKYIDWSPAFIYGLMIVPYHGAYCRYGDVDYKIYNASDFLEDVGNGFTKEGEFTGVFNFPSTSQEDTLEDEVWRYKKGIELGYHFSGVEHSNYSKVLEDAVEECPATQISISNAQCGGIEDINEVQDECCQSEDTKKESCLQNPYLYLFS